jgi:hypothetical protein
MVGIVPYRGPRPERKLETHPKYPNKQSVDFTEEIGA